jgi:FkbM family methyltransferase
MSKLTRLIACISLFSIPLSLMGEYPFRFEGIIGEEYLERPLELIKKFLPEDPSILEAGCYNAKDTLKFRDVWPKAKITAFEPNPTAYRNCLEKLQDLPNVRLNNLALNSYNGFTTFYVCHGTNGDNPEFEGASSILKPSDYMAIHYQGPVISVPCVNLEDWCKINNVDGFDFMWLDLEGAELQALCCSLRVLAKTKVIFIETNFQEFREGMSQFSDLRRFLEISGFVLLSHWYYENLQGNAIFINSRL